MLTYTYTNANPPQEVIDAHNRGECNFVVVNRHTNKLYINEIDPNIGIGGSIPDTTSVKDLLELKQSLNLLNETNQLLSQKIDLIQGTSDSGNMITLIKEMALQQLMFTSVALELNEKIEALSKVILSLH